MSSLRREHHHHVRPAETHTELWAFHLSLAREDERPQAANMHSQDPVAAGSASANKRPASHHPPPTVQTPDWSPGCRSCLLRVAAQMRPVSELQTQPLHNQRASQPEGSQDGSREAGQPTQLPHRTTASKSQASAGRSVPGPPPSEVGLHCPSFS